MCRALQREDIEVLIATTDADGPARMPVPLVEELEYQGVRTIFFPASLGERFNYSPALASWLDSNVRNFDVVHIHAVFSHPCVAAARACRRKDVPYVLRPLGSLDPWSLRQKALRKRIMWHIAARRMIKEAAAIHYTTAEEKVLAENSKSLGNGVVIPLGIEMGVTHNSGPIHDPPFSAGGPYVLALSRIHSKKNLDLLVEAFLSVTSTRSELTHWRLVIAGDGDSGYLASLRAQSERLDGKDRVVFTGWIEGEEKALVLRGASLFALPSRQENFGIAAAEAMANGVPVVVSKHVNLAPEIETVEAGWVTSLVASEFSRTLAEAMSDEEERRRRGAAGKVFAEEQLSWARSSAELKKLYASVCERASRNPAHAACRS